MSVAADVRTGRFPPLCASVFSLRSKFLVHPIYGLVLLFLFCPTPDYFKFRFTGWRLSACDNIGRVNVPFLLFSALDPSLPPSPLFSLPTEFGEREGPGLPCPRCPVCAKFSARFVKTFLCFSTSFPSPRLLDAFTGPLFLIGYL